MFKLKSITLLVLLFALTGTKINAQTAGTSCKGKGEVLEALGASSAMLIYNTYMVIGAISDGNADGNYEDELSIQLLDEQIMAINLLDTHYTDVLNSGFLVEESDKKFMQDVIKALHLLKNEAYYLKRYISSSQESDLHEYDASRKEAWNMIRELLGIEGE
jgi:hypothetical protein